MNQQLAQLRGVTIGAVKAVDAQGRPLVSGADGEAQSAQVVWMPVEPDWSRCVGSRVLLASIDGDPDRPVIIGLLDPPPTVANDARPDTLQIESRKELVIECGKSRIALRADGRIEIRGGHLISRSSGPNKIKGGTVHIN